LTATELHIKVTGVVSVNWAEMKQFCRLSEYSMDDAPVVLFWSVFDQLSEEDKIKMLRFITASECSPARGFARDPIGISKVRWNASVRGPLPVSHTCFRRLDLPEITDEATMRWALRICIDNSQGFGIL
jgi:hypothetical protein